MGSTARRAWGTSGADVTAQEAWAIRERPHHFLAVPIRQPGRDAQKRSFSGISQCVTAAFDDEAATRGNASTSCADFV